MFGILIRLVMKFAKRMLKTVKNPIKAIKADIKRIANPKQLIKNQFKTLGSIRKLFSKRVIMNKALKQEIVVKSHLIEQLVNEQNQMLAAKTGAQVTESTLSTNINKSVDLLNTMKKEDLKNVKAAIDETLKDLGVSSDTQLADVIKKDEAFEDLVKTNSYNTFMENWKESFLSSGVDKDGSELSQEEKEDLWQQIETDYTYDKFVTNKT